MLLRFISTDYSPLKSNRKLVPEYELEEEVFRPGSPTLLP